MFKRQGGAGSLGGNIQPFHLYTESFSFVCFWGASTPRVYEIAHSPTFFLGVNEYIYWRVMSTASGCVLSKYKYCAYVGPPPGNKKPLRGPTRCEGIGAGDRDTIDWLRNQVGRRDQPGVCEGVAVGGDS